MSITDELRDYMRDYLCDEPYLSMSSALKASIYALKSSIACIADRIDHEHEECEGFCRRLEDAASKGDEVALFGADYVRLPMDAEGIPFHVGDHVEVPDGLPSEGKPWQVGTIARLVLGATCWHVRVIAGCMVYEYLTENVRHVQPDSWERIIADAAATRGDFDELVARCKRLAGEDE